MTPDLCIYHGGCDDGFGAAYAVWRLHGADVDYHAGVYGVAPPDITGLDVAIVDFSYKRPVMIDLANKARSILVLDHHKTAQADLDGLSVECPNVTVEFDMNRSGAVENAKVPSSARAMRAPTEYLLCPAGRACRSISSPVCRKPTQLRSPRR